MKKVTAAGDRQEEARCGRSCVSSVIERDSTPGTRKRNDTGGQHHAPGGQRSCSTRDKEDGATIAALKDDHEAEGDRKHERAATNTHTH